MSDIGRQFVKERGGPDSVVVDAVSGPVTASELVNLAQSAPVGIRTQDCVGLRFACPANLARALFLLDGFVARLVLLSATQSDDQIAALAQRIGITTVIDAVPNVRPRDESEASVFTRWTLTTSGTTGSPKIVDYTFDVLARAVRPPREGHTNGVWGLLLDPTRFAGSQVLLNGLLGGGRLVCPDFSSPISDRVSYLAQAGCTYLTATPSLWRRMLMTGLLSRVPLSQVLLGGEIADQSLLASLARTFPKARIVHIYGSTETGQGFGVADGRAGFPLSMLQQGTRGFQMKIVDDILWARPDETPIAGDVLYDAEGYICTADRVRIEGDRVYFLGRDCTAVNIGGIKVQPEQVEAVLREHEAVADCRVTARPSALVGALLVAEVVPIGMPSPDFSLQLKRFCRQHLQREAQPAKIKVVESITTTDAGKLARESVT